MFDKKTYSVNCPESTIVRLLSREAILEAARHCFFSYGYSRTRIGDIADRAEVSRAHVYNHFDNKKAVFIALATEMLGEAMAEVDAALAGAGEVWERVEAAFQAWSGLYFELLETPHGAEMLDQAADLEGAVDLTHDQLTARITAALRRANKSDELGFSVTGLSAAGCADALVAAHEGFKKTSADRATYNRRLRAVIAAMRVATQPASDR